VRRLFVLIPVLAFLATPVSGQVAFDGPPLIGPASPNGLAIFLTNPEPGDGIGALATWRYSRGSIDVGYRASVGEGPPVAAWLSGEGSISPACSATVWRVPPSTCSGGPA
jgi:hypothetical protein